MKNLWSGLKRGTYDNNKSGNLSQKRVNDASAAGFTGYSSPYALMHELVDTQLRAKVISKKVSRSQKLGGRCEGKVSPFKCEVSVAYTLIAAALSCHIPTVFAT